MTVCDYCKKEIRTGIQPFVTVQITDSPRHYHADDAKRTNGDCVGIVTAQLETVTGDRPPVKP